VTSSVQSETSRTRAFWTLRVLETALLVSALVGLVMFAWSIVDIVRIETSPAAQAAKAAAVAVATGQARDASASAAGPISEMPALAWPGIFLFFGSLVLLQPVRGFLGRYRGMDGAQRSAAARAAAAATSEALASLPDDLVPADEADRT
jgi:hypothetical protein